MRSVHERRRTGNLSKKREVSPVQQAGLTHEEQGYRRDREIEQLYSIADGNTLRIIKNKIILLHIRKKYNFTNVTEPLDRS